MPCITSETITSSGHCYFAKHGWLHCSVSFRGLFGRLPSNRGSGLMRASVLIPDPSHLWKAASFVENRSVCVPKYNPDVHQGGGGGHIFLVCLSSNSLIWQEFERKYLTMGFYKIQCSKECFYIWMDLRKFSFLPPDKWRVFKGNGICEFVGRIWLFYWTL